MKQLHITVIMLLGLMLIASARAKDDPNLAAVRNNNAVSEKRIALVIGNSAYTNSPLKNPVNDAKDVAAKLRRLGFVVIERDNLKTKQIGRTLSEFRSKLVPGGVALVFYAGHGLQIKGENYLPAVDAEIAAEEDVPNQSLAVKQIMDVLDESKTRLNLVFLDACRNNPYARSFRSTAGEGLARISAPSGTLISYATRPGSVAQDGDGHNGLYTSKLLAQMDSNLQIELALKQVVTAVKADSQGKQEPWMEGSIEGDFCFAGCATSGDTPIINKTAQRLDQIAISTPVTAASNNGGSEAQQVNIQEGLPGRAKNAVCRADVKKFCPGIQPGEGRINACLKANFSSLSSECAAQLPKKPDQIVISTPTIASNNIGGSGAQQGIAQEGQRERAKNAVCRTDVKKFCRGVKSGEGRIMACLKANFSGLSSECATRLTKLGSKNRL
jgi:hypothetical protein